MPEEKYIVVMEYIGQMCGICQRNLPTVRNCPNDCPIAHAKPAVKVRAADGLEYYCVKKEKE